jgi:transcriptional regulator with XRE-family HTH domain
MVALLCSLRGHNMGLDEALGQAIKDVRLSKNLTQEFFSDISSRTHVSRIERGGHGITVQLITRLANAMGVHPLTILTQAFLYANEEIKVEDLQKLVLSELPLRPTSTSSSNIRDNKKF